MDTAFEEERINLQKTETIISDEIDRHSALSSRYLEKLNNTTSPDGFGQTKSELRSLYAEEEQLCKQFMEYAVEPYFGRMDVETSDGSEYETVYVGKNGITVSNNPIVIDWRSELGQYFFRKKDESFSINEYNYNLVLRRALEIKNGTLVDCVTEYDATNVKLEGEVVDPFLLTILRDKRREHRLTDIIKTIQEKQNDIIRKPINEQFIVQGCAGSGKTMILLHRLSYLKFNNRKLNWNSVKIITPNKTFESHIKDLSIQLGLDEIDRLSVDEYYVYLIKSYFDKSKVNSDVKSEKRLNEELLTYIYSLEYKEELEREYIKLWKDVYDSIDLERFRTLIDDYDLVKMAPNNYMAFNQDTFHSLVSCINELRRKNDSKEALKKELENKIVMTQRLMSDREKDLKDVDKRIKSKASELLSTLSNKVEKLKDILESSNSLIGSLEAEEEELKGKRKEAKNKLNKAEKYISLFEENRKGFEDVSSFISSVKNNDEIALTILSHVESTFNEVKELQERSESISLLNVEQLNLIKSELDEKKKKLSIQVQDKTREIYESLKMISVEAEESFRNLDADYKELETNKKEAKNKRDMIISAEETLTKCISLINEKPIVDFKYALLPEELSMVESFMKDYMDLVNSHNNYEDQIKRHRQNGENYVDELKAIQEALITDDRLKYLNHVEDEVKKLDFINIINNTLVESIRTTYKRFSVKYTKENYRHKLYLRLLFYYLYFPRKKANDLFVNIDEAQDISKAEYALLKSVLGEKCVFNLYGDTNQLVYSYKGITDWEEIQDDFDSNVYELNENYRNTLQITEYCNEEFSSDVYPIGISGSMVEEKGLDQAVEWLIAIKRRNPDYRCAILYRYGKDIVTSRLREMLNSNDVSWDYVDETKISVISVELAKGLEFESVISVVFGMTDNEKYISFTRALMDLCVVREDFVSETDEPVLPEENIEDSESEIEIEEDLNTNEESDTTETVSQAYLESPETEKKEAIKDSGAIYTYSQDFLLETIGEAIDFDEKQKQVLENLSKSVHTAFNAPSGSLKSILLLIMISYMRKETEKQSIITAEAFMQENELVMAERLGLKAGYIGESFDEFLMDVKKDKYDVIFVPFEFLQNAENTELMMKHFRDKIAFWGINHPLSRGELWDEIQNAGRFMNVTFYLMSKEGFGDLSIDGFSQINIDESESKVETITRKFASAEEKLAWFDYHMEIFEKPGIIYCDNDVECKVVSKYLRKRKIKAPEYTDTDNIELMNFLTNSFLTGKINTLVTTHEIGKNVSNPRLCFVVHFRVPENELLYNLHLGQIGSLSEEPAIVDFE